MKVDKWVPFFWLYVYKEKSSQKCTLEQGCGEEKVKSLQKNLSLMAAYPKLQFPKFPENHSLPLPSSLNCLFSHYPWTYPINYLHKAFHICCITGIFCNYDLEGSCVWDPQAQPALSQVKDFFFQAAQFCPVMSRYLIHAFLLQSQGKIKQFSSGVFYKLRKGSAFKSYFRL